MYEGVCFVFSFIYNETILNVLCVYSVIFMTHFNITKNNSNNNYNNNNNEKRKTPTMIDQNNNNNMHLLYSTFIYSLDSFLLSLQLLTNSNSIFFVYKMHFIFMNEVWHDLELPICNSAK